MSTSHDGVDAATVGRLHQLYGRQSHLIDGGSAGEWALTFTADGEFHSPSYPEPVVGAAGLTAFAERFHAGALAAGEVHRHVITNVTIDCVDADALEVRGYLQIVATPRGGSSRVVRMTTFTDRVVYVEDRWRIARRDVRRDDVGHRGKPLSHIEGSRRNMTTGADQTNPGRTVTAQMTALYPEMSGKVAVVTGAAQGMGAAFAEGLATRGVHVVGADINEDQMTATAASINAALAGDSLAEQPGRVVGARVDVTVADDHEKLAQVALQEFGRIDFWINNAGIFPFAPAEEISPEQIHATLTVNVEGVLFGAQAAARHIRPGGAIVNMSSVSALRVRKGRGAYCASKAAVAHLTESLAVEFGDKGIRVNSIAPGYIDTAMTRWVQDDPAALAHALDSVPLHRLGSPEEVFGPLLFLLSDSARYVTGHSIAVDGGSRHV